MAVWLRRLLHKIGYPQTHPTPLFGDNQNAIRLLKNPEYHKCTKHIDIQYHFIREKFKNGEIDVSYISTAQQVADIITKPLPCDKFERFRSYLPWPRSRTFKPYQIYQQEVKTKLHKLNSTIMHIAIECRTHTTMTTLVAAAEAHIYKQWKLTSNSPECIHLTAVGALISQHQVHSSGSSESSHLAATGAIATKHHKWLRQKAQHQTSQALNHKWHLPYLTLDQRTLPFFFRLFVYLSVLVFSTTYHHCCLPFHFRRFCFYFSSFSVSFISIIM